MPLNTLMQISTRSIWRIQPISGQQREGHDMTDQKKDVQGGDEINTIERGEELERENAKDFGEPVSQ